MKPKFWAPKTKRALLQTGSAGSGHLLHCCVPGAKPWTQCLAHALLGMKGRILNRHRRRTLKFCWKAQSNYVIIRCLTPNRIPNEAWVRFRRGYGHLEWPVAAHREKLFRGGWITARPRPCAEYLGGRHHLGLDLDLDWLGGPKNPHRLLTRDPYASARSSITHDCEKPP